MPELGYNVEVKGLEEQLEKFRMFPQITTKHMTRAMNQARTLVQVGWQGIAPIDTGRYLGSIKSEIKTLVGGEVVGIIGTNATDPKSGHPYPVTLEVVPGYHYRSTHLRGKALRGQVKQVIKRSMDGINKFFKKAVDRITKELAVRGD